MRVGGRELVEELALVHDGAGLVFGCKFPLALDERVHEYEWGHYAGVSNAHPNKAAEHDDPDLICGGILDYLGNVLLHGFLQGGAFFRWEHEFQCWVVEGIGLLVVHDFL